MNLRALVLGFAALTIFVSAEAGEGGKFRKPADRGEREDRKDRREEREGHGEKALLGDPILFAITKSDELALNAQQVEFLKQLRKQMEAERAKDKDEESMRQIYMEARDTKKKDPTAARVQKEMYKALAEKQGKKWEEREMKELEKVLPKDKFAKLKELRGESSPTIENPFE